MFCSMQVECLWLKLWRRCLVLSQVFLEYAETESSSRARNGMNGRKFGGNEVVAVFYPEDKFEQADYSL